MPKKTVVLLCLFTLILILLVTSCSDKHKEIIDVNSSVTGLSPEQYNFSKKATIDLSNPSNCVNDDYEVEWNDQLTEVDITLAKGGYEVVLKGTINGCKVEIESPYAYQVSLSNASISGPNLIDGRAIELKGSSKIAFMKLIGSNSLSDASSNKKKGVINVNPEENTQDLVIYGSGSLSIVASTTDGIKAGSTLKILGGTISIDANAVNSQSDSEFEGHGITATDCFIMDNGVLTISSSDEEDGKGIRVKGAEADGTMRESAKGFIEINGGEITIDSIDKAITANWEADEDAETETTDDDPIPNILITGGTIAIKSINEDSLEAKNKLTVTGGTISSQSEKDKGIAAEAIDISDGYVFASGKKGIKGKLKLSGGTLVVLGTKKEAIDSGDNADFTFDSGCFAALGKEEGNIPGNGNAKTQNKSASLDADTKALLLADNANEIKFNIPSSFLESGVIALLGSSALSADNMSLTKMTSAYDESGSSSFHGLLDLSE